MFNLRGVIGLLLAVGCCGQALAAETHVDDGLAAELRTFLERVAEAPLRTPRSYSAQLADIRSAGGRRIASPQIELVAGRLNTHSCLYQLRLQVRWSGRAVADENVPEGGRSLLRQTDCETLAGEVSAAALYEVSALRRRLQSGGRLASNQEREQIIAAARHQIEPPPRDAEMLEAVTIAARVNLRRAPSLQAPVLSKLAPLSPLRVVPVPQAGWYQLPDQGGYIHASALVLASAQQAAAQLLEVEMVPPPELSAPVEEATAEVLPTPEPLPSAAVKEAVAPDPALSEP